MVLIDEGSEALAVRRLGSTERHDFDEYVIEHDTQMKRRSLTTLLSASLAVPWLMVDLIFQATCSDAW